MRSGGLPAGSGRVLRLDPFALPARYDAADARADGLRKAVELHRERVVVRRAVAGMRMAVNLPVSSFRGIALRMLPPEGEAQAAVALVLDHDDPSLTLPLFVSTETDELAAQWESWSQVLGVPRIVDDLEGGVRAPFASKTVTPFGEACERRRRRSALRSRRPSFLMRRRSGSNTPQRVHRNEREIIARN